MALPIFILMFAAGLVLLAKGADWVTDYAAKIARELGVSQLVIGITIVAIATSLPELAVSLASAVMQTAQIATGTIIGSNISNMTLVLGASALLAPLVTGYNYLKQEYVMLLFTFMAGFFLLNGMVWYEGAVLIIMLAAYMFYLIRIKKPKHPNIITALADFVQKKIPGRRAKLRNFLFCLAGGIVVVVGARLLVDSTVGIAQLIGISEVVIAMVVIALGTSLPEFAASFTAARKGMRGISIGNIIGSNIFNLAILGLTSLVTVVPATMHLIRIDLPIMLLVSVVLLVFIKTGWKLSRKEGIALLALYCIFVALQFVA